MDVLIECCAGLDIGKKDLKACVRRPAARAGRRASEVRTFATTTRGLLALSEWLTAERVSVVGMESTGDYWKPVFYLLEGAFEAQLLNARHIRNVPGRKTDVTDAVWIAQLVEHGLIRPSFAPPPPIRRLRDLTRYRTSLVRERTREAQRLEKLLEDAGLKLSAVVSDVLGASGRAMLTALIAGERDPQILAALGDRRLRATPAALAEALQGQFTAHHATLARLMLTHIDQLAATVAALDAEVDAEMAPFTAERALVAIGHAVLVAAWSMLTHHTDYTDLGPDHHLRHVTNPARRTAQLLSQLHDLGYNAILEPLTAT
jgi:transposase